MVDSNPNKKTVQKKSQAQRIWPSIKKDFVNPSDYLKYDFRSSCDDCSHFDLENSTCSLGYIASHHRRDEQIRTLHLSGNMALCRFHEID